jgi:hypothetical protein
MRGLPLQGAPIVIERQAASAFDRSLVLSTAIVPFLIIALLCFVAGVQPRPEIGGSLVALSGLALVLLLPPKAKVSAPRVATVLCLGTLVMVPLGVGVVTAGIRPYLEVRVPPRLFAPRVVSALAQDIWRQHTSRPLTIVTGDFVYAELVALYVSPRASVFIDADFRKSPWITPERLRRAGTLIIWQLSDFPNSDELPPHLRPAFAGARIIYNRPFVYRARYGSGIAMFGSAVLLPEEQP